VFVFLLEFREKGEEGLMQRSVISVIVPAYNEEKTIGHVLSDLISVMDNLKMPYEIIVVDDGSTDETRRIASSYKASVLLNETNRGKGYALRNGFSQAQGDIIVTMDADGAHSPKEIPELIYPLFNGVDIVAGSRLLGRGMDSTSRLNRLGNFLFNITIMVLTRTLVTDSQTGFRAFKRKVLQEISLESLGYEIETEITIKGLKNGFVFQEKPIGCNKRTYSVSKIRVFSDGLKIFKTIFKAKFA
jgi:glycosyltransferase involved in cell wall biosynthesis